MGNDGTPSVPPCNDFSEVFTCLKPQTCNKVRLCRCRCELPIFIPVCERQIAQYQLFSLPFHWLALMNFLTWFLYAPYHSTVCCSGCQNTTRRSNFRDKKKRIQAVVAQLVVLIMPFVSVQINLIIVFVIREKERLSKWMTKRMKEGLMLSVSIKSIEFIIS